MENQYKKYRLTSVEEPTDEMLLALMADFAVAARDSSESAQKEKQRRLRTVAQEIQSWRASS